jgi:hypothetical protein
MKKIKIIAGIIWAFLCLILIIILFPGLNSFSTSTAKLPFMKINPNYSGGEVARQLIEASCTLDIRKPVFDGLIKERNRGFVQIDWRGNIPDKIVDTIDYDLDKIPDFCIFIDRNQSKTVLDPINKKVRDVIISTPTSYGWAVRVELIK